MGFLQNYAEEHAISLPGRQARHWITDIKLLPTSCTKKHVFQLHKQAAITNNMRVVSESQFLSLWNQLVPFIRTMPPKSDLCWQCQDNIRKTMRMANRPDDEKAEIVLASEKHLKLVDGERQFYKETIKKTREQPNINLIVPGRHAYCSFAGINHVSFDFAQQTHFPSTPQQIGPVYFKTPRKCGLFGVNCEAKQLQVNYLIDEGHACGKGANSVISYVHDFLENHSLGEEELYLSADNATGQNKNNMVMWYLLWRCLTGRNTKVHISFLIAGHTKFSPDGGFGLMKRKLRKAEINSLADIEQATNDSAEMNLAKVVGYETDAQSRIPTYDWNSFLAPHFSKIIQIKSFHHFIFTNSPSVTLKEHVSGEETTQTLFREPPHFPAELPDIIKPAGLSIERQHYLFNEIREYVNDPWKDIVCPQPQEPLEVAAVQEEPDEPEPSQKRQKTAGKGKGTSTKGKGTFTKGKK